MARNHVKRSGERVYGASGTACAYRSERKKTSGVVTAAMIMASTFVVVKTWLGERTITTSDFMQHKYNADLVVGVI